MLQKANRFHGSRAIRRLYSGSGSVRTARLGLRYRTASSKGAGFRVAVVVSRKVSKSAVVRNRIRRRVYELMRVEHAPRLPKGTELLITVFDASLAAAPPETVRRELSQLLQKARLTAPLQPAQRGIVEGKKD